VEVYSCNVVDRKLALLVGVALGKPFKAIVKPDRSATGLQGFEGNRRDHSIRARRWTATNQDADSFDSHRDHLETRDLKPVSLRNSRIN
jgi:hypothetical protein